MTEPSPMLIAWFTRYTRWYLKRNFNAVRCSRGGPPPQIAHERPAIVFLNHPSWWDPLIGLFLAKQFWPNRQHFAPIEANALRQYPFLNRVGFFGVERSTRRGLADFLENGSEILARPGAMIWITAEGEFTDPRRRDRPLLPGFIHLAEQAENVSLIPLAIEYPFWKERRGEALCRFGDLVETDIRLAEQGLRSTQDALSAESSVQNPEVFDTLLTGTAGVQPFYDAWRRLTSLFSGKKFAARHARESA